MTDPASSRQARPRNPTAAEFAAMTARLASVEADASEAKRLAGETHDMVQAIHTKLMQPQPGQNRSLLDRMASVTIDIESGKRSGQMIVALVGFALACAALIKWAYVSKG